jgi:hypothetical protein
MARGGCRIRRGLTTARRKSGSVSGSPRIPVPLVRWCSARWHLAVVFQGGDGGALVVLENGNDVQPFGLQGIVETAAGLAEDTARGGLEQHNDFLSEPCRVPGGREGLGESVIQVLPDRGKVVGGKAFPTRGLGWVGWTGGPARVRVSLAGGLQELSCRRARASAAAFSSASFLVFPRPVAASFLLMKSCTSNERLWAWPSVPLTS